MHGIISVHFHLRRSESGQKLTKFDPKSWNQKESVQESIQESKGIGFSSQHQPPEPKNPSPEGGRSHVVTWRGRDNVMPADRETGRQCNTKQKVVATE